MSHFAKLETKIKDKASLVKGLEALLNEIQIEANVEVHDTPTELANAYGDTNVAEIILRRSDIGGYVDVGFAATNEGVYEFVVDAYDFPYSSLGDVFDTVDKFLHHVSMRYAVEEAKAVYPETTHNYTIKIENDNLQMNIKEKPKVWL